MTWALILAFARKNWQAILAAALIAAFIGWGMRGYSKAKALAFNLLSSLATLVGAMLAYFALSELTSWIPSLLGLAAASMIYVAVADLIPGLHKRTELKATVQQVLLIVLGVASIALVQALVGE